MGGDKENEGGGGEWLRLCNSEVRERENAENGRDRINKGERRERRGQEKKSKLLNVMITKNDAIKEEDRKKGRKS